ERLRRRRGGDRGLSGSRAAGHATACLPTFCAARGAGLAPWFIAPPPPKDSMKALRSLAPCLAALALLAATASAQQQPRQLVGQRVRITAPNITREKVVGTVTAFDTAQLVVHDSLYTDHAFPLHSIQFMEISRGNTRGGSAGSRAGL